MAGIPQSDEHELLERLREGDAGAFTALYNRYWRKLFVAATNKLTNCQPSRWKVAWRWRNQHWMTESGLPKKA